MAVRLLLPCWWGGRRGEWKENLLLLGALRTSWSLGGDSEAEARFLGSILSGWGWPVSLGHRVAGLSATSVPVGEMQKPLPQSAHSPLSVPEPSVGSSGDRPPQIDRGWLFLQCVVHRAPSLAPASGSWVSSATLAALPLH